MAEPLVHHIPVTEYWLMYFGTRLNRYNESTHSDPLDAAIQDRRQFSRAERRHLFIERVTA